MARRKRTPEENARQGKIRELLEMENIGSMEDIQGLFKETIAEFMENGLAAGLEHDPCPDDHLLLAEPEFCQAESDNNNKDRFHCSAK